MKLWLINTIIATSVALSLVELAEAANFQRGGDVPEERTSRQKRSETSGSRWSLWFNSDRPWTGEGDIETTDAIKKIHPICSSGEEVVAAECKLSGTNDTFDSATTAFINDHLLQACSSHGLICLNSQQPSGICQDYEVRFLCQDVTSDDSSGSLFPNFNFKVYIVLAIVPIFIVSVRIGWSCCCKDYFKRRSGQQRNRRRQRDSLVSSLSSSSSQGSIDSSLANPPPAYTELFGNAEPAVFAISDGSCRACGKCVHHGVGDVNGVILMSGPSDGQALSAENQAVASSSGNVADSDDVFTSSSRDADDTVASQNIDESLQRARVRPSLVSISSAMGAVGLPVTQTPVSLAGSSCECACHSRPSGQVNLAFHWESTDHVGAPMPVMHPGMHKPVFAFSRIGSESSFTSFTSFTEPPDYEEALEILKKSGLVFEDDAVVVSDTTAGSK